MALTDSLLQALIPASVCAFLVVGLFIARNRFDLGFLGDNPYPTLLEYALKVVAPAVAIVYYQSIQEIEDKQCTGKDQSVSLLLRGVDVFAYFALYVLLMTSLGQLSISSKSALITSSLMSLSMVINLL